MSRWLTVFCIVWPVCWLAALAGIWPASVRMTPYSEELLAIWKWEWLLDWRWLLAALQIGGTVALVVITFRRTHNVALTERFGAMALMSVLLCGLLFPLLLYRHSFDPRIVANVLYYGPVLALLWPISAALHNWTQRDHDGFSKSFVAMLIVCSSIFYWVTGMAYTHWCGEHAGDEGHYLIQVASLYQDGDLDIRNQYEDLLGDQLDFYIEQDLLGHRLHVSPASRDGRWYSYHTPGLSLLTFWTYPFGMWARHLVLALIAGFGVGGIYVLCRLAGARHRASMIVITFYMSSLYAVVYASRFLPEMLGATLITWLMVAVMRQAPRPVLAAVLAASTVSFLPWAHLRFLPMAGLGFGFFGLYGLFIREPWIRKIIRLGAFTLLAGGGILIALYWQHRFFEGGYSHPVGALFMNHPKGLWQIFTRHPAFADVFPLIVLLLPAGLLGWRLPRAQWPLLVMLATLFLATWVITCSGRNFGGGATLAGRFLVAVTPLLLPAAALFWMHTHRAVRTWIVLLGLLSIAIGVVQFVFLPELGRSFSRPFDILPLVAPLLWGWHTPWPAPWVIGVALLVQALLVFGVRLSARIVTSAILLLAGLVGVTHLHASGRPSNRLDHDVRAVADQLATYRMAGIGVDAKYLAQPVWLFDCSNQLVNRYGVAFEPLQVTSESLSTIQDGRIISQPLLADNDWEGRGLGWATLWPPAKVGRGERALWLKGRVDGSARPVLALREGSRTIIERPLVVDESGNWSTMERFQIQSRHSLLYILIRLEGEGVLDVEDMRLSPVSDRMLATGKITL